MPVGHVLYLPPHSSFHVNRLLVANGNKLSGATSICASCWCPPPITHQKRARLILACGASGASARFRLPNDEHHTIGVPWKRARLKRTKSGSPDGGSAMAYFCPRWTMDAVLLELLVVELLEFEDELSAPQRSRKRSWRQYARRAP